MTEEYPLSFGDAIRAMLDGKLTMAKGNESIFRFNTKSGFQYRTYDARGNRIWRDTFAFIGTNLPICRWKVIDISIFDPCPFCGNKYIKQSRYNGDDWVHVQINCDVCGTEFKILGKDLEEITRKWNERVKESPVQLDYS